MSRALLLVFLLLGVLAASSASARAGDVVIADPAAQEVAALDGTIVWVSGERGAQVLMRSTAGAVTRVPGAPVADRYRRIDLGRDGRGRLVLTYQRCMNGSCRPVVDDLEGHQRSFQHLWPPRCRLSTAPAIWGRLAAFGLSCVTATGEYDAQRSGLYVRALNPWRRAWRPRRLPMPEEALGLGIRAVDLSGGRAAGVAGGDYDYAFSVGVDGRGLRSFLAAASEGETQGSFADMTLGPGDVLWTLASWLSTGDPLLTFISRLDDSCLTFERLVGERDGKGESEWIPAAIDIAVDGPALLLVAPGRGIVLHAFTPLFPCPQGR